MDGIIPTWRNGKVEKNEIAAKFLTLKGCHGNWQMKKEIGLSPKQIQAIENLFQKMKQEAMSRRLFPLSLGIRVSSVDLTVKLKSKDDYERVTLKFPE